MEELESDLRGRLIDEIDTINRVVCQLTSLCHLLHVDEDIEERKNLEGVIWLLDDKLDEIKDASDNIYGFFCKPSMEGKEHGK